MMDKTGETNPDFTRSEGAPPPYPGPSGIPCQTPYTGGVQQPSLIGESNIGVNSGHMPYSGTGGNNVPFTGGVQPPTNMGAPNVGGNSGQTVVFVANPSTFTYRPMNIMCPHCGNDIRTETKTDPSTLACCIYVFALWPFCLIPCCMKQLHNVDHNCPVCRKFIGRYER